MLRRLDRLRHVAAAAATATAAAASAATALHSQSAPLSADVAAVALKAESEDDVRVENWSGTHTASPSLYFQPDTPSAVERIVALAQAAGARLRVVGSKISPNGIGLSDEAMLDMAQLDAVLSVDVANRTATVQAGVRVSEVVEALRPQRAFQPSPLAPPLSLRRLSRSSSSARASGCGRSTASSFSVMQRRARPSTLTRAQAKFGRRVQFPCRPKRMRTAGGGCTRGMLSP